MRRERHWARQRRSLQCRVAKDVTVHGYDILKDARVFLMFASANRDEAVFERPDDFDLSQDASRHIAFGAGPHFCAGAAISKCVVADVALPSLFAAFPALELDEKVSFSGWAFRGPVSVNCRW